MDVDTPSACQSTSFPRGSIPAFAGRAEVPEGVGWCLCLVALHAFGETRAVRGGGDAVGLVAGTVC